MCLRLISLTAAVNEVSQFEPDVWGYQGDLTMLNFIATFCFLTNITECEYLRNGSTR